MPRLLVVVASGPEHEARALEGLSTAEAIHRMGMLEEVRVLLTGPGVRAVDASDPEAERLYDALEALFEAKVPVGACTRSLAEHRLLDAAAERPELRPVGAPTQIAEAVAAGTALLTF